MTISNITREDQAMREEATYEALVEMFGADAIEQGEDPYRFVSEAEMTPEARDLTEEADLDWWADQQREWMKERY
jgi:hypothetical protein